MEERDKQLLKMIRKHPEEGMGLLIDEYGGAIKTICSNVLHNYDADIFRMRCRRLLFGCGRNCRRDFR